MDRMRRVMRVWNWLPAFRAVAETEHLTQAARQLHVTPPALSRTLKLLEDDLGTTLFARHNHHLVLNASGRRLLESTRTAIRLVHDALAELERVPDLEVRVSSLGRFTAAALDGTLSLLLASHPHLRLHVSTAAPDDPVAELLRGRFDVVFTDVALFHAGVVTESLGSAASAVYCGPGHPLHGAVCTTGDELARHGFAAPACAGDGEAPDGWPRTWHRTVVLVVDGPATALAFCLRGRVLAVLPETVARDHPSLHRLPIELAARAPLFALRRETVGEPGPVEALVDYARRTLSGCPGWTA